MGLLQGASQRCDAWKIHHGNRFGRYVVPQGVPASRRAISNSAKDQKTRLASFARGLGVIARAGEARPRLAPIVGTLRRPLEIPRMRKAPQRPRGIIRNIGYEAEFTAAAQAMRQSRDRFILHKSALPMPPLRPRIGMNEIDARQ